MQDEAITRRRVSFGTLASAAWVSAFLLGLGLPGILFFYSLLTSGPIESSTPNHGTSGESLLLLMLARLSATATTALIVVLSVLARHHGLLAVLIWVPGIVTAAAALLLWDIRPT